MNYHRNYWVSLLAVIWFIAACKNSTSSDSRNNATAKEVPEGHQFQLKLPAGAKYYCSIVSETVTTIAMNSQDFKTTNESTFGLQYEVLFSSPDSIVLKATYQKFHIEINTGDDKQVTDADNAGESQDVIEKMLSNIKGSSLLITLNSKGKVKEVSGSDAITEKVLNGLSLYDQATKQKVRAQLTKMVGNEFIKNNIEAGFNFYPDTAVKIGDNWQAKLTQPGEINFEASTTYTLNSLEGGVASIAETSTLTTGNKGAFIMKQQVNADIKGETNGSYEVDIATGMLTNSKSKAKMEGVIQISIKEIPIEIITKKEITIKRI